MAPLRSLGLACLALLQTSHAFMIPSTVSAPGLTLDDLKHHGHELEEDLKVHGQHLKEKLREFKNSHSPEDVVKALPMPNELIEKMKNLHLGVSKPWPFPISTENIDEEGSFHLDSELSPEQVKDRILDIVEDLRAKFKPHFDFDTWEPHSETQNYQDDEQYYASEGVESDEDNKVYMEDEEGSFENVFSKIKGGPKKFGKIFQNGRLLRIVVVRPQEAVSNTVDAGHRSWHHYQRPCAHRYAHSALHKVRYVVYRICSAIKAFITNFLFPVLVGIAAGMAASLLGMLVGTLLGWLWVKMFDRKRSIALSVDVNDDAAHSAGAGLGEKDTLLVVETVGEAPPVYVEKE